MATFYLISVISFDLLILLEYFYARLSGKDWYKTRDAWSNISMYWGFILIYVLYAPVVYAAYQWVYQHSLFKIPATWWAWIFLFIFEDFCFYWFHRTSHEVPILWASHVNHHSSTGFNLATAVRQTWTPFLAFIFWLPLLFVGFDPYMVIWVSAISLFYQAFLHTQAGVNLGPLEYFFNTPAHHRIHHGSNEVYTNRNFGGILIIWDRWFGSFQTLGEPIAYGIHHNIESKNPFRIALHEYANIFRASGKKPAGFIKNLFTSFSNSERPLLSGWSLAVESNISILLIHSFLFFTAVVFVHDLFAPVTHPWWFFFLLVMAMNLVLYLQVQTGLRSMVLFLVLNMAMLAFPLYYENFFTENRWLTALAAFYAFVFTLKGVSYMRHAKTDQSFLHLVYFTLFAPALDYQSAFRLVPGRTSQGYRRMLLSGLYILLGLCILLLFSHWFSIFIPWLYIPMGWHTYGYGSWQAWVVLALKGLCFYYLLNGFLTFYVGLFNAGGFNFAPAFYYPFMGTSVLRFWQRFDRPLAAWFGRYLNLPGVVKMAAGFIIMGFFFEYFMFSLKIDKPGYMFAFFVTQAVLSFLTLPFERLKMKVIKPILWIMTNALVLGSSVWFFKAWDQLFYFPFQN